MKRFTWLLIACVLLGLTAAPGRAADDEEFRLGTHALRRILHDHKLTALKDWSELDEPPDTILILLGNNLRLDKIPNGLTDFLARGGVVLIATDQPLATPELSRICNHSVGTTFVTAWTPQRPQWRDDPSNVTPRVAPAAVYQEQADCLIAQPTDQATPDIFYAHNQFGMQTGKLRVATNRSSYLQPGFRRTQQVTPLAYLPRGAWYGSQYIEPPLPLALHARHGAGELLLFADHSLFLNEMVLRRDIDNLELTYNTVDYLMGTEKPRSKVLFVHDSQVITKLDVPIVELPFPLRDMERLIVATADEALASIQDAHQQDQRLDTTLLEGFDRMPGLNRNGGFYYLLALVLGLAFIIYALVRLVRATNTTDLSLPLFSRAQGKVAPLPSLLEHRYEGMRRDDNYGAVARAVVSAWFASLPGGRGNGAMPQVVYEGGWWARRSMVRLVRRLWRLAQGIEPRRVSAGEFQTALHEMERLSRDLHKGQLHLEFV